MRPNLVNSKKVFDMDTMLSVFMAKRMHPKGEGGMAQRRVCIHRDFFGHVDCGWGVWEPPVWGP